MNQPTLVQKSTPKGRRKVEPIFILEKFLREYFQDKYDSALEQLTEFELEIRKFQTEGVPASPSLMDMITALYIQNVTSVMGRRVVNVLNKVTADPTITGLIDVIREKSEIAKDFPEDGDEIEYVRKKANAFGIRNLAPITGWILKPKEDKCEPVASADKSKKTSIHRAYTMDLHRGDLFKLALGFKVLTNAEISGEEVSISYNEKRIAGRARRKKTYFAFCIPSQNCIMLISSATASSYIIKGTSEIGEIEDLSIEDIQKIQGLTVTEVSYTFGNLKMYEAELANGINSNSKFRDVVINEWKAKWPTYKDFCAIKSDEFRRLSLKGLGLVSLFRLFCGKKGDPIKCHADYVEFMKAIYSVDNPEITKLEYTREEWIEYIKSNFSSAKEFLMLSQKERNHFKARYGIGMNKLASLILGKGSEGLNPVSNMYHLAILAAAIWGEDNEYVKLFNKEGLIEWFKNMYKKKEELKAIGPRNFGEIKVEDMLGAIRICAVIGCTDLEPQKRQNDLDTFAELIFAS